MLNTFEAMFCIVEISLYDICIIAYIVIRQIRAVVTVIHKIRFR